MVTFMAKKYKALREENLFNSGGFQVRMRPVLMPNAYFLLRFVLSVVEFRVRFGVGNIVETSSWF